ncbi:MAG: class I SAM-dependent methyltransferase [Patescibacteria group bacterium]
MELRINKEIRETIRSSYGHFFSGISNIDPDKIVDDVLSFEKPHEQIAMLRRFYGDLKGKKLLEVGSGFGNFITVARVKYDIDAYGVEPSSEGFDDSFSLAKKILLDNGINPDVVINGKGEALPFPDNSFDICYSSNVLEHVDDPKKVIAEMVRVTKPGGIVQIVVPNYGPFFEGHYAMFYVPYQPKWLWKLWLKFISRRDISFVDTLRTNLNYFSIKRMTTPLVRDGNVEILSWGDEVFRERMNTANFSDWAGLGKVKVIVRFLHTMRISSFIARLLSSGKAFTPIILTMRKK